MKLHQDRSSKDTSIYRSIAFSFRSSFTGELGPVIGCYCGQLLSLSERLPPVFCRSNSVKGMDGQNGARAGRVHI
jgi:hypothetical protein